MLDLARAAAGHRLDARSSGGSSWSGATPPSSRRGGAYDLVVSSFVLQLVDRVRRRCARHAVSCARAGRSRGSRGSQERPPSGPTGWSTRCSTTTGSIRRSPARGAVSRHRPSAAAATRRAGFSDVRAHEAELVHTWTPESYLAFLTEFDEANLFEELERGERQRPARDLGARRRQLLTDELTMRLPTVYAVGRVRG